MIVAKSTNPYKALRVEKSLIADFDTLQLF